MGNVGSREESDPGAGAGRGPLCPAGDHAPGAVDQPARRVQVGEQNDGGPHLELKLLRRQTAPLQLPPQRVPLACRPLLGLRERRQQRRGAPRKPGKPAGVDGVGLVVPRAQNHSARRRRRLPVRRDRAPGQQRPVCRAHGPRSNRVQCPDERRVPLPEHLAEHNRVLHQPRPNRALEREGGPASRDRGQLVEVPHQHRLHAPHGRVAATARPRNGIHLGQEVGVDHGHLLDHEAVSGAPPANGPRVAERGLHDLPLRPLGAPHSREGVERDAPHCARRDARGRGHDHSARVPANRLDQPRHREGLSRAGRASEKHAGARPGELQHGALLGREALCRLAVASLERGR
mmetsp:Transcript_17149/g.64958  ORF Transcript_17149/g.64958 Transcript_17149/m.64958 type:complete len:347 (-) Transcript_17149:782-1822(-)